MAVAALGTVALTAAMLPFREVLATTAVGVVFVVPVVVSAAVGGLPAAIVGVTAGFLAFNVLFTEPYRTVKVQDVSDVIGLGAFVLVGAISSLIVALQHRAEAEARQRADEAATLAELSRSLISPGSLDAVLQVVVDEARELFGLTTAAVLLPAGSDNDAASGPPASPESRGGLEVTVQEGAPLPEGVVEALAADGGPALPDGVEMTPMRVNREVVGQFVTRGGISPSERALLRPFADQAAVAVQRARLAEQATRAEVLEGIDQHRTALLRSVSHDLRTPLASMRAAADDLADPTLPLADEDRQVLAGTIVEEAERLDRLVENLLDLSRVQAGGLSPRVEAVDLRELVGAIIDRQGGAITVHAEDALPVAAVDPVMIEQAIDNLVDNALRHGSVGTAGVEVRLAGRDHQVEVTVIDHGPGIPRRERQQVFEPFARLGEQPAGGSGVGLSICRGFVEAHGGEIWVEETPGGGATVRFTVPAADPPPDGKSRNRRGGERRAAGGRSEDS